jgi:uncharacterized protein YndB with AHSA1/START domain
MREFHGSASTQVNASPAEVFAFITDLDHLPEWNQAIRRIVERPAALTPGAEWVVVIRPRGMPSWKSRSHLEAIESGARFEYRSHTDDDHPSYAHWRWDITPNQDGVRLTVGWDGHPKTWGRKLFAAPLRRRMLEREVSASLDTIRRTLESSGAQAP